MWGPVLSKHAFSYPLTDRLTDPLADPPADPLADPTANPPANRLADPLADGHTVKDTELEGFFYVVRGQHCHSEREQWRQGVQMHDHLH